MRSVLFLAVSLSLGMLHLPSFAESTSQPFAEVDSRYSRIERRLIEALTNGRLTPANARTIKDELEKVAEMEAYFRVNPSKLTQWQCLQLGYELDKIGKKLELAMNDRRFSSSDLTFTKEDTLKSIDNAVRAGRLSVKEMESLKSGYKRLSLVESSLRKSQGGLSYLDRLMLCVEFDHLAARARRQMSERPVGVPDVSKNGLEIEQKIAEAVKSGKISQEKEKQFAQELSEIRRLEADFSKAKRIPDVQELMAMGILLESLSDRVLDAAGESVFVDGQISARLEAADAAIGKALQWGSLNPLEAMELKEDLDSLVSAKNKLTGAKAEELAGLKLDIARLEGRLDRQMHEPTRLWSGIPSYQASIGVRIQDGGKAGRLSADEVKTLLADSEHVTEMEKQAIADGAKLTAVKALEIVVALEKLSGRLDRALKDRTLAQVKNDNLQNAIDERIGEALVKGQLNTGEAREYKALLQRYAVSKDTDASPAAVVEPRQALLAAYELQRIYLKLEEQIHDNSAVFPGLDTRRAQVEALIEEGLASGRLSMREASAALDDLIANIKQEKEFRATGATLTAQEAIDLVGALERSHENIGSVFMERQITMEDLVFLESNLERKIIQGVSRGLLLPEEAEVARKQYEDMAAAFLRMRGKDGGLSYGERLGFAYGFTHLATVVERNMRSRPLPQPNIELRYRDLEQQLASHMVSGRLSLSESRNLKTALDDLLSAASRLRSSGGGMSYPETLVINADFDKLGQHIEQKASSRSKPLPDLDSVEAILSKRIKEMQIAGKLSKKTADTLHAEMDRIAQCELNYRLTDENLTYMEALNLMLDLERVHHSLEQVASKKAPAKISAKPKKR
ncbi:MAG: hypothetical protein K2W82_01415 [Candidatus Obscuribacterales bacterium]|nr:hypothetical protein [Candidatus Obscuribacterales bacterium]